MNPPSLPPSPSPSLPPTSFLVTHQPNLSLPPSLPPSAGNYPLALLTDPNSIGFNLYPFVHLLPSGNVFIFAGQNSVVLNVQTNQVRGLPPPCTWLRAPTRIAKQNEMKDRPWD